MEQANQSRVAKVKALPRKGLTGVMAPLKKFYQRLKDRYGPRYTQAMLVAAFTGLFLPIPAGSLVSIALVVVIAEAHRTISLRGSFAEAIANLVFLVKANMPWWSVGRWPSPPGRR